MSPVPPFATESFLAGVIESMAEGVIVYDSAGRALLANVRACLLLGLTQAQIRGEAPMDHDWLTVRADGSKMPFDELPLTRVRLTSEEVADVLMGIRRADRTIWLSGNAVPVALPDGSIGVISTFRDASEVKVGRDVGRALRMLATRLAPAGVPFMDEYLGIMGEVAEADCVLHIGIDRQLGRARTSREWSRTGHRFEPIGEGVPLDLLPRLLGRLGRRELVMLVDRDDLPDDGSFLASPLIAWGLASAVAAPLIAAGALEGFITIGWTRPAVPHPRLLDFVVVAAELLSSRTERERAHDEFTRRKTTLEEAEHDLAARIGHVPAIRADGGIGEQRPQAIERYFHLVTRERWEASISAGIHAPPSLGTEGFVHLSTAEQVARTVERHYRDVPDLLIIELDPERLGADVVFEEGEPGEWFPHLFGPVQLVAVIDVKPWSPPSGQD